ncbi:MAG: UDP-N-acetylmuramoyl-tripeptide--D-alanyl-D-alanine ligase [Clostridia bacterium]|nr:UDP-N-acetylmuramoyl-tripeptide--D-alanyl-D-alanine ligase [Clostridia bacterium]
MEKTLLSEIAIACDGVLEGEDREIFEISTDTRTIKEGSLFVAIRGENFDGHDFCRAAYENGASALLVERKVDYPLPQIIVDDTRKAQLLFAKHYRSKFVIPVVGVTGSVGKTTTKEMIYAVLSSEFKTLKTEGNFNNDIGVPKMIFRLDGTYQAAVFEMGMSDLNEITHLSKAAMPTVSVISNIGVSHLENLKTRENILKAKLEILDGMADDAPLIINIDNDMLSTVKLDRKVITVAIENKNADCTAENIVQKDEKTFFDITYNAETYPAFVPTIGIHNVYNALEAFCVGVQVGIEPKKCADALAGYVTTGMRQRVRKEKSIVFIEDCYNASPDSQKAGLNALKDIEAKRHIAVLGDMLELGAVSKQAHYDVGKYAAEKGIDMVFALGEESQSIFFGAKENGIDSSFHFLSKDELSKKLLECLQPGDAVIFKASRGMKLEEVIKNIYKGMGIENE